ncbi:MAG: CoB--CoM heterodisulfide reductase iron-sulfur subunit A family protein [bacterium]
MSDQSKRILVIGGGMSGISAALEAAEVGHEVVLVEREPYLGGRVSRMYQYFPKMCPPICGLEINFRRIRSNPRIKVYTMAEVVNVAGEAGDFDVKIKLTPRYVTGKKPVSQAHKDAVQSEVADDYNLGMCTHKALYLPHEMAYPYEYVLDKEALTADEIEAIKKAEPQGAVDLDQAEEEIDLKASAIVVATGWQPFDAARMQELGFGKYPNVINNVQMERLCALNGPTSGEVKRPSDNEAPASIAFIQCVGSRDENHLPYCSGVCCMGTLKQTRYIREKLPEAEVSVFYIDIRTIGRLEKFYYDLLEDDKVNFIKGKVPKITEAENNKPVLHVEEMLNGHKMEKAFDMVVLAAGVVPNTAMEKIPGANITYDDNGFVVDNPDTGIIGAGCVKRPLDVSRSVKDATAAALKAIQIARR